MATFHISEVDASRDFAGLMARVRAGAEVVIEEDSRAVAILRPARPVLRTVEEVLALLSPNEDAVIDEDFAKDVLAGVEAHREPLNADWD